RTTSPPHFPTSRPLHLLSRRPPRRPDLLPPPPPPAPLASPPRKLPYPLAGAAAGAAPRPSPQGAARPCSRRRSPLETEPPAPPRPADLSLRVGRGTREERDDGVCEGNDGGDDGDKVTFSRLGNCKRTTSARPNSIRYIIPSLLQVTSWPL
uniref:Uncharacterized protein n=1 Tax=Aegilops tauschii subsp. strangulata TaxID=200361 RepID=A0A453JQP0_AEGTS